MSLAIKVNSSTTAGRTGPTDSLWLCGRWKTELSAFKNSRGRRLRESWSAQLGLDPPALAGRQQPAISPPRLRPTPATAPRITRMSVAPPTDRQAEFFQLGSASPSARVFAAAFSVASSEGGTGSVDRAAEASPSRSPGRRGQDRRLGRAPAGHDGLRSNLTRVDRMR